ncbi:MAG: UDP-N-acetylmuramoyl-tripeptide--D-alanyl-D-alanine ligase [Nakamurella sp.]
MISMTVREVAAVVGAVLVPATAHAVTQDAAEAIVTSVEFDSRKVRPGSLFVALPGEHVDGHDFAEAAAAAGAVAVLGTRPVSSLPTLVVGEDDVIPGTERAADRTPAQAADHAAEPVLRALSQLAHRVVAQLIDAGLTVVGVTGSAGKTSTKDLISAVLSRVGTVVAPPESFNNELGHPYTVLRADEATRYLVLELSARGIGHIAKLTRIAQPQIGAVLNVGSAHLGEFGSRDAIAQAKGELVEALPSAADGGVAILNADDERVAGMASRSAAAIVTFGVDHPADVRAVNVTLDPAAHAIFDLVTPEGSAPVHLAVVGAHHVSNALAAAAVGRAMGLDVAAVADALSNAGPVSKWRMAVTEISGGIHGGVTLINDAYNANPESMLAAINALGLIGAGRTRWAVLGEMAELGAGAPAAHYAVGQQSQRAGVQVLAVGARAQAIFDGANDAFKATGGLPPIYTESIDSAVDVLSRAVQPTDVVLVKASRAVGLEVAAARLIETLPSVLADRSSGGRAARSAE